MSARYPLAALLSCALLAGCTFKDTRNCARDSQCDDGDHCYKGFCVAQRLSSSVIGGQGSGSDQAGKGGSGEGGRRGVDAGMSGKGGSGSSTQDSGGSMECSGDTTRPCNASWEEASALGGCGQGMQHCVNGVWGSCTPDRMMITTESCNGIDDDCDGQSDEDSDEPCFPDNSSGCDADEQGNFNCRAPCKAGVQHCSNGSLQNCVGFTVAAAKDDCSTELIDENCDGTPNDKCQCMGSATRDCYTGAMGTQGVGICAAGKQKCVNGQWGTCDGAVTQQGEICNGKDDDCNNKVDDLAQIGTPCTVPNKSGVCREGTFKCIAGNAAPQCVATAPNPAPETCDGKDNDCNGAIDDVPASQLQTDMANCGMCKKTCGASDKCCAGACIDSSADEKNCGTCGKSCSSTEMCITGTCTSNQPPDAGTMCDGMRPCASGELCCSGKCVANDLNNCGKCGTDCTGMGLAAPACCSNACVDLAASSNCGKCGNVCPSLDGGATCMCATTGTPGMFECRNGTTACQ